MSINTNPTPQEALHWLMAQGDMQPQCPPEASNATILNISQPPCYCPTCWYAQFPDQPFPAGFTSATCPGHYSQE